MNKDIENNVDSAGVESTEKTESKMMLFLRGACESMHIDIDSLTKLTLKKFDYAYRKRKIDKNQPELGDIMDRGFIGLLPGRIGIESTNPNQPLTCFVYGKKTIGFVLVDDKIIVNQNIIKSADFICLLYNFMVEKHISIENLIYSENLPTGARIESPVKSIDDCLESIKTVENLDCELGF